MFRAPRQFQRAKAAAMISGLALITILACATPFGEIAQDSLRSVRAYAGDPAIACILFLAIMLLPLGLTPVTPILPLCGLFLGPWKGLALGEGALIANAILCHIIARRARPSIVAFVRRGGIPLPENTTAVTLLMIRANPLLPLALKNYALAILGAPLPGYLLWFVVFEVSTSSPVILGAGALTHGNLRLIIAACATGTLAWLTIRIWTKRNKRELGINNANTTA